MHLMEGLSVETPDSDSYARLERRVSSQEGPLSRPPQSQAGGLAGPGAWKNASWSKALGFRGHLL